MKSIIRFWLPYYILTTIYSTVLSAPLLLGGFKLSLAQPQTLEIIIRGLVYALTISVSVDVLITYWFTRGRNTGNLEPQFVKNFSAFIIYRSLSVHWLGFCIPLSAFWFNRLTIYGHEITAIETIYFIVVALLMSYLHAVIEYFSMTERLEVLVEPELRVPKMRVRQTSLAAKIARVTIFVGIVPLALLSFTFYLKLLHLNLDRSSLTQLMQELAYWGLSYALLLTVMSILLVRMLARDILKGSFHLTEGFKRLASGDHKHRLRVDTADEFESLAESFNTLASELEAKELIYREFGRHVDPTIRDQLLAGRVSSSGEQRHAVILFCDIADFTELAETLEADELISLLNETLDRIVNTITRFEGTINKFIGDEVLAIWNVPVQQENAEGLALLCAVELLREIERFNILRREWRESRILQIPPIRVGIGIHAGKVIVGTVGSENRREFTVVGSNVNIAARLQQNTRSAGVPILFGTPVHDACFQSGQRIGNDYEIIDLGPMKWKGMRETQAVYGIRRKSDT